MTDDPSKEPYKVGYGNPPKEHQFKKGQSGNRRGRPRKQERSFLPRQLRNDVLAIADKEIVLNTRRGKKKMPAAEALLEVVLAKAMTGHMPSVRFLHGLIERAVHDHTAAHYKGAYEMAEQLERGIQLASEPISEELMEHLDSMRRATRSLRPVVAPRTKPKDTRGGKNK